MWWYKGLLAAITLHSLVMSFLDPNPIWMKESLDWSVRVTWLPFSWGKEGKDAMINSFPRTMRDIQSLVPERRFGIVAKRREWCCPDKNTDCTQSLKTKLFNPLQWAKWLVNTFECIWRLTFQSYRTEKVDTNSSCRLSILKHPNYWDGGEDWSQCIRWTNDALSRAKYFRNFGGEFIAGV